MSEVFEGIVFVPRESVQDEENWGGEWLNQELGIYRLVFAGRVDRVNPFSVAAERKAGELSVRHQSAVLFRNDSRTGYRSSIVYGCGEVLRLYGPDDELFVALDDDGDPLLESTTLRRESFDPAEEYETVVNAIELGLQSIGGPQWRELLAFFASR